MTRRSQVDLDHMEYIRKYLSLTRGIWPRIARELQAAGVKCSVSSLSMLCNGRNQDPRYSTVMKLYAYMRGPGQKWLP